MFIIGVGLYAIASTGTSLILTHSSARHVSHPLEGVWMNRLEALLSERSRDSIGKGEEEPCGAMCGLSMAVGVLFFSTGVMWRCYFLPLTDSLASVLVEPESPLSGADDPHHKCK